MALIPDSREIDTEYGANRFGRDFEGNPVVISGSHEAIQDYGWSTIWQAGEAKYTQGAYEQIGEARLIRVTSSDCADEHAD